LRDLEDLKDLKRQYLELVRTYGKEATELKRFQQSLLELNRRHRLAAARMYANIISKIEKKMDRPALRSRRRPAKRGA
jgi:hypothetical protein